MDRPRPEHSSRSAVKTPMPQGGTRGTSLLTNARFVTDVGRATNGVISGRAESGPVPIAADGGRCLFGAP
jgi:hypothetical protein